MSALLKAYHRLPPFTRGFVASAHGLYLRRWRYGPETDSLAAEALKRDHWPKEQWEKWQQAKLARVLRRAVESVPWYRQDWERKRAGGALGSPDEFKNWRILRKEDVRANPKAFLADNVSLRRLHKEHTSGTTGTPLSLWRSREAARQWYALMEARWRGWYGLSRHDPWAILGGQLVTPVAQRTPPFWVWNAALKQLYLSSYHLSSETCASYFGALRERRVVYLWGYASSLFSLALFAREQRLNPPELKVVISNAEPLPAHERELMQSVFGCPVRDTYGMSEMVCAASECEHGRLHLWPDAGLVEVLADEADEPVPVGTVGRLVSTSLIEDAMLLIRYEVGDRGALADPANRCPCGRTLPVLQSIEGRDEDVILTPDHRRIGRLDPLFKADFPIREAQIIQDSLTALRLRLVPDVGYSASWQGRIVQALRERVGDMAVTVECLDHIPRSENGKFRAVISQISQGTPDANRPRRRESRATKSKESLLLKAFHALPPFAQNWAASVHGYSLKAARYGWDTAGLAQEALERDYWSPTQWSTWRDDRLRRVLRRAALRVPYYRQYWEERRRHGDNASFEVLANWPILRKESLRAHPEQFVATDCDRLKMNEEHTSGTTGTPLTLWRRRETLQRWYALNEARVRLWSGVSQENKWGHIGGQPVIPPLRRRPPYWVWNAPLRQLYLSWLHISPQTSRSYLTAIKNYNLEYLLGYSTSIACLAEYALEHDLQVPLKVVITDAEPLLSTHRAKIAKAFSCSVRETYGMAELVCAASECSSGSLHVWPEAGFVELLTEDDDPVAPGQEGRVVATSLLDEDMPLIRYDTRDLGQFDSSDTPCACGRGLQRFLKILGRDEDIIITEDGRRIVQIDQVLDPSMDILESQVIQEDLGRFLIKVVPGKNWEAANSKAIIKAIGELVGKAEIRVQLVSEIERHRNGKFRFIVSKCSGKRVDTTASSP